MLGIGGPPLGKWKSNRPKQKIGGRVVKGETHVLYVERTDWVSRARIHW